MFKFAKHEANLLKYIYYQQSLEVFPRDLDPKKMPHPPSHMKEGGAKVEGSQLMKILKQKI